MEQNRNPESPFDLPADAADRPPLVTAHMPEIVEPLVPSHPDTAFSATRQLRHDGWTPERKRLFLERLAECGVVLEAALAAGMSARAAYNLRDRDPLFAAGWEAACVMARPKLADEAWSRSMNGIVERIYRNGIVVAEKHRYDNRLTMAVLARLDSRVDRAEETGAPHLRLVARWDDFLTALGEDRREDGLALLAPPAPAPPGADLRRLAGGHELHELRPGEEAGTEVDRHKVWEEEDGWWTDYPPPPGFDGEEEGEYGDPGNDYRRRLSPAEQAVIDSEDAEERAEQRARAEAQRDAWFGFAGDAPPDAVPGAEGGPDAQGGGEEGGDAGEN